MHTFLDRDTGCLFGQAVAALCVAPLLAGDGAVTEVDLSLAVASVRDKWRALALALGLGTAAGPVTPYRPHGMGCHDCAVPALAFISSSAYGCLQRRWRQKQQPREERAARVFFFQNSASGNMY